MQINLSPSQKEIVTHANGAILVKASAGSGKTRVLTERIKLLLGKTKRKILAITFTNKAGEEMQERLKDVTELRNRLFVGTFHSFCQQILENHGKLIGLNKMPHIFEEEADRLKLIEQAVEITPSYYYSYKEKTKKEKQTFLYNVLSFISEVKRELLSEQQLYKESKDENLIILYKSYQEILFSQNAIDFDDLILLAYNLFADQPSVSALYRRTYEYICIDEAQDLNNAQYQFLKVLTNKEHQNIMMVGDPNQSIFGFNGSSPEFMCKNFVEDFHPTIIELIENYRSSKSILQIAEKLVPDTPIVVNTVIQGIFEIYDAKDEKEEAEWICRKILDLVNIKTHPDIEGNITYDKIAVLARNKYVFNELEKVLEERQIPFYYKISPGAIKFETRAMKIFDMALRIKLNPQDILHYTRLLELLNVNQAKDLLTLSTIVNTEIEKQVLELVVDLNTNGSNLKQLLNKLLQSINTNNYIGDDNEKRMVINDILEVLKHWYNYAIKTEIKSLHHFKNSMALGNTHPQAQTEGITLSTVHTMKGQEYDIVFLMGMDDETFPDYRAVKTGGAEMIQERNNLYVAFTRAKRFLFLTWPNNRLMPWGDVKTRRRSRLLNEIS
jgi:DNA helicase II / ATP-dependent DNA helicase PcrA